MPFGRFEHDLSTAALDLAGRDQHLLVLGDTGSGRTNLLRVAHRGPARPRTRPRSWCSRSWTRGAGCRTPFPEPYLGGYATNPALAQRLAAAVATQLAARGEAGRAPGDPRIVLVVDDYDVLAASGTQPLAALVPHLAGGRDLGLHVLLTRRVAGASRGLYEPFVLGVRESGCAGLILSGDRSEGQLLGTVRASVMPVGGGGWSGPARSRASCRRRWRRWQ